MRSKVTILSAGLGNISRGFEISAATWFNELKSEESLDVRLFSGGPYTGATKIWNFSRNSLISSFLRRLKLIKDGSRLEQITFGIGFLFHLISYKPDVIWVQEGSLAQILLKFKRKFKFRYKLIFCDGAPVGHKFANQFDYIIFLHQYAFDNAMVDGIDPQKCAVIPYISVWPPSTLDKVKCRQTLGLEKNSFVIICVAAWNKHHKRIDYLLQEIAQLEIPDMVLLLCGQPEEETKELKEMAASLNLNARWSTLSQQDLSKAYIASDLFVLPSLTEGLGAVLIEAGAHRLPVICHPHDGGRFIFGEDYNGFADLFSVGNLAAKIKSFHNTDLPAQGLLTEKIVRDKFCKKILVKRFTDFIKYVSSDSRNL